MWSLPSFGDRSIEGARLVDDFGELTAAPGQGQPQRSDCRRMAASALHGNAFEVGLRERELGSRFFLEPL